MNSMKRFLCLTALLAVAWFSANAQGTGGLSADILSEIKTGYQGTAADKAIRNALNTTPMATLAANAEKAAMIDTHFSDQVKTRGITNQKSSGRCWLFSGLNVLRARAIEKYDLGDFQFSQNYLFFYDQLEKANLFLQGVIDTRDLPFDDRTVDWLFSHPIGDGGQFTGVSNLVTKYGLVPAEVMPESFNSENTAAMSGQIRTLLREDGLRLRQALEAGKEKNAKLKGRKAEAAAQALGQELQTMKVGMLKDIYHVLCLCLGTPPEEFSWTRCNGKGERVETKTYTPLSFYKEFVGEDLEHNYVMLMNDPSREFYKVYEIEYDRHVYDGDNWVYVNLPVERIKEMAITSIKDNTAMYFSCDVGKCLDRTRGIADLDNFDYESLLGVQFGMDKKERILTHTSGSSHAMNLIAVDLVDGKPVKWMVENSWGPTGYQGKLIMTDRWFDEYMFRLVVEKKYVPADVLKLLDQKPVLLPAWDPMFLPEE